MNNSKATARDNDTAAQQTQEFPPAPVESRPDAFELQIIEAFQRELSGMRTQMYAMESKIRRYDRAFESMFKEELDRRLNGDKMGDNAACEISPLEHAANAAAFLLQRSRKIVK